MDVWLEPQAQHVELLPGQSLDFVFLGPPNGIPEVLPTSRGVAVYGWHGAQGSMFREGALVGSQRSVADIVHEEVGEQLTRLDESTIEYLGSELDLLQNSMDSITTIDRQSQQDAFKWVAYLVERLRECLPQDNSGAESIWRTAAQILNGLGVVLIPDIDSPEVGEKLRGKELSEFAEAAGRMAYSFLPGLPALFPGDEGQPASTGKVRPHV
jgi:hypothetical protein